MRVHPYVRAVANYATARSLFSPEARVLIALSGGPDSCALLVALHEAAEAGLPGVPLPSALIASHFHHGLRGADADADAAFSAALAAQLGIPCAIGLGAVTTADGRSPNDAARRDRYAFLEETAHDFGATILATAHTLDDQAETVLGRVLRGTSVDGLGGIALHRSLSPGLSVVRPLLGLRRAEGIAFLADRDITPRHDPSNDKDRYARSRLRKRLPTLAADFNPRLVESLGRLSAFAAEDAALLGTLADDLWERAIRRNWPGLSLRLDTKPLVSAPPALVRRVLLRALTLVYEDAFGTAREEAATAAFVEVLQRLFTTPGKADLPGGVRAASLEGILSLDKWAAKAVVDYRVAFSVPGSVYVEAVGMRVNVLPSPPCRHPQAGTRSHAAGEGGQGGEGRSLTISCDARALSHSSLILRPAQGGERMAPLGMGGKTRLVRDMMADAGWSAKLRAVAPVVYALQQDGSETPLWIVGLAQAEVTRVTEMTTEAVCLSARWEC